MSPVLDKLFPSGPMRDALDLSVVRVRIDGQFFYLKDCPTPRFSSSTNNCSIFDQSSAKRIRDHAISLVVRDGIISTVGGDELTVVQREVNDTLTSMYEKVLAVIECVRIKDMIPEDILSQEPVESCHIAVRKRLISLFRKHVGVKELAT